ncbi:hypothetical protein LOK49_LG11G00893 [Camellia lanceoleosa]|uniref:Uncharacterized protein n=1 Tax=Camellia lanceoleosa TaxID=1840588 RepID=A0ACC0G5U7_9ERIC|nr:hypothetical protein LOK49_LG11G00893 [Camellia lanceoleosa]
MDKHFGLTTLNLNLNITSLNPQRSLKRYQKAAKKLIRGNKEQLQPTSTHSLRRPTRVDILLVLAVQAQECLSLLNQFQLLKLRNDTLFNSGHPNFDDLEDIVKTMIAFWAKNNLPGVQYRVHDFVHNLQQVRHCLSPVAGCVVPLLWSCYGKPSAGVFAVMNCCCWSYSCWFSCCWCLLSCVVTVCSSSVLL